ncbi:MAG: RNA 2',3'-cyclic phosphodiesterase [Firmicutes bacterium]|nr:RNA 2',3'-cyclic phosphodiesterase [Bacillota bacterium]
MRLFIAVNLSSQLQQLIDEFVRANAADSHGVKWIDSRQAHFTLFFLGEQSPGLVAKLSPLLGTVAARQASFTLTLGGGGAFPSWKAPRVLWLGVQAGKTNLAALAQEVSTACNQVGIPGPDRPFIPHLTLGRVKTPRARFQRERLEQGVDGGMLVEAFALMESRLTPEGPLYREVEVFRLG